jgi:hypothetical protein
MTEDDARQLVEDAIKQVIENDIALLELNANERSLSHQLARYMAQSPLIKPPLSVDCEYNRNLGDVKRLRMTLEERTSTDTDTKGTTVFPDIIVHERNSHKQNLIVLELKKQDGDIDYDEKKLKAFKAQYGYQHAANVILGQDTKGLLVRSVKWLPAEAAANTQQ